MKRTKNQEAPADFYDKVFKRGAYLKHPGRARVYEWIVGCIKKNGLEDLRLLDVGCGPGGLSALAQGSGIRIDGYDFSHEAIDQFKSANLGCEAYYGNFSVDPSFLDILSNYDVIVMSEVLEHIQDDLQLLKKIPHGKRVIITVPHFSDKSHVRFFDSLEDASNYYEKYIKFLDWAILNEGTFSVYCFYGVRHNKDR